MPKIDHILSDDKTKSIIKNITLSGFVKGISVLVNFAMVPVILSYLTVTRYGVWLTISSVLGWFTLFDLGIGNGLRNRIAESNAGNNIDRIKGYVSTTYAFTTLIFLAAWAIFAGIFYFVDWALVFNAPSGLEHEIAVAVFISVSFLCVQSVFRLITTILLAYHKPALADIIVTAGQLLILPLLFLLARLQADSLVITAAVFTLVPVLVLVAASFYLFSTAFANIRPSFKKIEKKYVRSVMGLGWQFFVIQMAALVMYTTDNMIITQLFEPSAVTVYNVSYKYFSVINFAFTIILTPVWSMVTKAKVENDVLWLEKSVNRLRLAWLGLCVLGFIQLLVSSTVYHLWVGDAVQIPFDLSAALFAYFIIMCYTNIYATFLNGLGKINLQVIFSIIGIIVNIPLSIYFAKYLGWGVKGVALATIVSMLLSGLVSTWQLNHIFKGLKKLNTSGTDL